MKHRVFVLVLATCLVACGSWKPVVTPADAEGYSRVRVEMPDGRRFMLRDPSPDEVAAALKYASSVDVRESNPSATAALVLVCLAGGVGLAFAALYAIGGGVN